jgi:peptidoglycan-N-acetylglucosamine deacetylase
MMSVTRREALVLCPTPLLAQTRARVAITMDDVRWQLIPDDRRTEADQRLLGHLGKTRAFLFAIGQSVDNPHGAEILKRWSAAGHRIGNHTYSHRALSGKITPEEFEADILRNEDVLRGYSGFRKFFRFPALREGTTREVRDRLRAFLARHDYRNGAVTIDTSDWYYNQCLLARIEADRGFDVTRYRQPYLDHIRDRARFCDRLARDVLGRGVPHTLLIHYNLPELSFPRRSADDVSQQRVGHHRRGRSVFGQSIRSHAGHRARRREPDPGDGEGNRPVPAALPR